MPAAYDSYNYPQYWEGREYEHKAEIIAINELLAKVPKISSILDIGAGFGRLVPTYLHRVSKITLIDPSAKLLKIARGRLKNSPSLKYKKIRFIQSKLENLPKKIRSESVDLVLLVRVLHHLKDIDEAFFVIEKLTKKKGFLILEFANKRHVKAIISEFIKGNLTYLLDIFPKELGLKKTKASKLPFMNYHPDAIVEILKKHKFKIMEIRSVSNIRNPVLKHIIPLDILLNLEKILQRPLARICFGPSIFILARKT